MFHPNCIYLYLFVWLLRESESCFGRLLDVHFRAAPLPLQLLTLSPSPGVVPWVWQRKREQSWPCSGHDAGQDLGSNTPNRFGFIRRFWRLEKHSIHSIWFLYLANFSQFYTWSHSHIASYCITTSWPVSQAKVSMAYSDWAIKDSTGRMGHTAYLSLDEAFDLSQIYIHSWVYIYIYTAHTHAYIYIYTHHIYIIYIIYYIYINALYIYINAPRTHTHIYIYTIYTYIHTI